MDNELKKEKYYSAVLLCISILFYLFFAIYDGVIICADSPSYIDMYMSREPFYCIFLGILRAIFNLFTGENTTHYLTAAVYIQSLLAALAAWSLADYLKKEFNLSRFGAGVVLFIPLATSLLCRFAAIRASMYSNSILTEGIACSLFLIYIRYLLEFYYKRSIKCLIVSGVLSFILISTRKQMYITLILLIIVALWTYFAEKKIKRGILTVLICGCCIIGGNIVFDNSYNLLVHGELGTHSNDNRFMATMVFYASERVYGDNIEDADARALFYQIYDICDAQGYLKHNAGQGWYNRVKHFGEHYDNIQIDTMWPAIEQYVRENYDGGEIYLEQKVDEITNQIITGLLPKTWLKVLGCFIDNFLEGLVTTVAQMRPILIVYSLAIYVFYLILLILQIKLEGMTKLSFFAICTMFSVVINVAVVSMVIFCQTRYTIYNMPIFYITLWILFIKDSSLLFQQRDVKNSQQTA
ncbi:MAG: hypothetical protein J1F42_05570 [Lachnospiraceae bacterium]|nr:hypothetical protein [Lachnospiraceae bacterium]